MLPPARPVALSSSRSRGKTAYGRRRHPMTIHSRVGFRKMGCWWPKIWRSSWMVGRTMPWAHGHVPLGQLRGYALSLPSYRYWGRHVYTNKPPATMRGFGAPQSLLFRIADEYGGRRLGIDH